MALTSLSSLLSDAREGQYAIGYFEAWDTYSMEAVVEAAEAEGAPVMIGFGGMMMEPGWLSRYGIEPLGAYGQAIAEGMSVPAALILNEVPGTDHAIRGIGAGFNVVMADTCEEPIERNIELTKLLVERAHPAGVEVQAELGRLPSFGEDDSSLLTDPDEAVRFVSETSVDCLAVSIGNMHLRTQGTVGVDIDRLRRIRQAVDVPLVIHGGSGLDDDAVRELVREGVTPFHVGTTMKRGQPPASQSVMVSPPEASRPRPSRPWPTQAGWSTTRWAAWSASPSSMTPPVAAPVAPSPRSRVSRRVGEGSIRLSPLDRTSSRHAHRKSGRCRPARARTTMDADS